VFGVQVPQARLGLKVERVQRKSVRPRGPRRKLGRGHVRRLGWRRRFAKHQIGQPLGLRLFVEKACKCVGLVGTIWVKRICAHFSCEEESERVEVFFK